MFTNTINLIASIIAICSFIITLISWIKKIGRRTTGHPPIPRRNRFNILLRLGLLTAFSNFALWSLTEIILSWHFGAGGSGHIPHGWSAIALSLTVTIPLMLIPPAYQALAHQEVTLPNHWMAALLVLPLGALAHLVMYGFAAFVGLDQMIALPAGPTTFSAGMAREFVFSCTYFLLIAFPYRLFVRPTSSRIIVDEFLGRTVFPALVFFLGMTIFIVFRYPESLNDSTWVQVRGVLSGAFLLCCLCSAMFE